MMEERYHATTQNRLYPDMSNVNKNITVEAKLISPTTYVCLYACMYVCICLHEEEEEEEEDDDEEEEDDEEEDKEEEDE